LSAGFTAVGENYYSQMERKSNEERIRLYLGNNVYDPDCNLFCGSDSKRVIMKKPYDYKQKSPMDKCIVCGEPLKMNLIAKKGTGIPCYKCERKIKDRNPRARKDNKLHGTRRIDKIDI